MKRYCFSKDACCWPATLLKQKQNPLQADSHSKGLCKSCEFSLNFSLEFSVKVKLKRNQLLESLHLKVFSMVLFYINLLRLPRVNAKGINIRNTTYLGKYNAEEANGETVK